MNTRKFFLFSTAIVMAVSVALVIVFVVRKPAPVSDNTPPDRVSIAYCKDIAPFHFTDEDGQPAGIMIDLW